MRHTAYAITSDITIVEPTGVPATIATRIPRTAQNTEKIAAKIVTDLKLLNRSIEETAGKIISAEIRRVPTRFIARTMITATITAMKKLYSRVLIPLALEKPSSKVIAKILL